MSIQWTVSTLTVYMLLYLNKYLAGGIYIQYYFDGIAGFLAFTVGKYLYQACRVRISFIISYIITIIGLLGIYLFETNTIDPKVVTSLGVPNSGFEEGSEQDKQYYLAKVIPVFSFLAKVGCHITILASY